MTFSISCSTDFFTLKSFNFHLFQFFKLFCLIFEVIISRTRIVDWHILFFLSLSFQLCHSLVFWPPMCTLVSLFIACPSLIDILGVCLYLCFSVAWWWYSQACFSLYSFCLRFIKVHVSLSWNLFHQIWEFF